ncbi:MAG: FecR domain-containing protein [Clostridiales bacterium]|nr:FecR domain-containing protein [Clostridiales bacterium]
MGQLVTKWKNLTKTKKIIFASSACAVLVGIIVALILSTSGYYASTMRLLRVEGTVNIEDSNGNSKPIMENSRFQSGDAINTGSASLASIALDDSKIITLDENSRAEFSKKRKQIELKLTEGGLYFNVQKPLEDDEAMNIKTSTMIVGIRGTSGYVTADENGRDCIFITDGHVHIIGTNPVTGETKETDVNGGHMVRVYLFNDRTEDSILFELVEVEEDEIPDFVVERLAEDPDLLEKVCDYNDWNADVILQLIDLDETEPSESGEPSGSSEMSDPSLTVTPTGTVTPTVTTAPGSSLTPTPRGDSDGGNGGDGDPTPSPRASTSVTPTPTLRPGVSATPTPSGTSATPTPRPTSAATPTPRPTGTVTPTSAPGPTSTPKPTATPRPTATPEPTSTPEPTTTPEPTSTPEPTDIPGPTLPSGYSRTSHWGLTYDGHDVYIAYRGNDYKGYYNGSWVSIYIETDMPIGDGNYADIYTIDDDDDETIYYAYNIVPETPDLNGTPSESSIPDGFSRWTGCSWGETYRGHGVYIITDGSSYKGYINDQWWDLDMMVLTEDITEFTFWYRQEDYGYYMT